MTERLPETFWRVLGVLFFAGVIVWRALTVYPAPATGWPLAIWWVDSSVYALIIAAYLRRTPARERAAGVLEVGLPLVGGVLPFALLQAPWKPQVSDPAYIALVCGGAALSAVSYAFLGGSFSILVEARELRSRGPYRLVRHPVYLGQLIAVTGVVLGRFAWWSVLLGLLFATIQITRAVLEERKLLRATPGYAEYRARTWMLVPFVL